MMKQGSLLLLLIIGILMNSSLAWWDPSFEKAKDIEINTSSNNTFYQMYFNITYEAPMQTDFDDVYFIDDDDTTTLHQWLWEKVDGQWAVFGVNLTDIDTFNETQVLIYFGNSSSTDHSNCSNTFLECYDFGDATTQGWSKEGSGGSLTNDGGGFETR